MTPDRRSSRWVRGGVIVLAGALLAGGCSSGNDASGSGESVGPTGPSVRSHPFAVSAVPDGYDLVAAGTGEGRPEWHDTEHSTPNLTVLRPSGGTVDDDVLVSGGEGLLGYPYEGRKHLSLDRPEARLQLVGRAPTAVLRDIAETVALDDGLQVPVIADPPKGWAVIGSVTGEAALTFDTQVQVGSGVAPGPRTAHGVVWRGPRVDLTVMTLPGRSISLDVVLDHPDALLIQATAKQRTIAGRRAVVVRRAGGSRPDGLETLPILVLVETSFGDVVVVSIQFQRTAPVVGSPTTDLPSVEDLVRVVASVRPVGERSWSSLVDRVHGGPGLHPDLGTSELASGAHDGVRWILQDRPGACMKFATGERACTRDTTSGGSPAGPIGQVRGSAGREPFPEAGTGRWSNGWFVTVVRPAPGGRLRLTTRSGVAEAPFQHVGDEDRWAAVVFSDQGLSLFTLRCPPLPGKPLVEVVEPDGSSACLTDALP